MAAYKRLIESLEGGIHEALRNVLQALGLKIHFDPETKEGYLNFDPFGQHASEQKSPAPNSQDRRLHSQLVEAAGHG